MVATGLRTVMAKSNSIEPGQPGITDERKTKPLSPQAAELLQERQRGLPIWIRSPKHGNEFYTGLSRAKLYELAGAGKIRSHSLREPGQVKGTRLFNLQSILDFIERCEKDAAKN